VIDWIRRQNSDAEKKPAAHCRHAANAGFLISVPLGVQREERVRLTRSISHFKEGPIARNIATVLSTNPGSNHALRATANSDRREANLGFHIPHVAKRPFLALAGFHFRPHRGVQYWKVNIRRQIMLTNQIISRWSEQPPTLSGRITWRGSMHSSNKHWHQRSISWRGSTRLRARILDE